MGPTDPHKLLDAIGWKILEELQNNARISFCLLYTSDAADE